MANWYEGGKQKSKSFSVRQLGYEGAPKKAAIAHRREMERQPCTFKDNGQAGRRDKEQPSIVIHLSFCLSVSVCVCLLPSAGLCSPRDDQATTPSRNALAESSTASPTDLSFSLYPELMAKAVTAPQTTAPLPTASTAQTAAVWPRVATAL